MIENIKQILDMVPLPVTLIVIGFISGLIIRAITIKIVRKNFKPENREYFEATLKNLKLVTLIFIPGIIILILLANFKVVSEDYGAIYKIFQIVLILSGAWFLIKLLNVFEEIILRKYDIEAEDKGEERKVVTQLKFLKKIVIVGIFIIALSAVLLSFKGVREFGAGLMTSAGIASLVIGLAAQKSISNLIAGFQIAFTQPIRLNDVVIVEGEWGTIEEITLTYVVVRIWDQRRLVLPINYFINNTFQNWTRNDPTIIGQVYLYLDYRLPVDEMREYYFGIIEKDEGWDGNVKNFQVVDATSDTMVCRAIMSAKNGSDAWHLKCRIREQLIKHISEKYPDYLPRTRVLLDEKKEGKNIDND